MGGGIGLGGVLLVVFIILKLTGVIAWSWLWVLAPLWIPFVIAVIVAVVVFIAVSIDWGRGRNPFN
jgi:hypothetical protein